MAVTHMLEIIRQLEAGALDRQQADELGRACSDSEDVQEGITAQREKARLASTIGDPTAIVANMLGLPKKIQTSQNVCP